MSTSLSWLEQIAAQFRDLKYEEGTPVFATVFAGPIERLEEQQLPCVSLMIATTYEIQALVFVAKLDGYYDPFPTSVKLDAEIHIYNIIKITHEKWSQGASSGYLGHNGIAYRTLHYTFYKKDE